jgi:NitT/TauT family transport system permease protein
MLGGFGILLFLGLWEIAGQQRWMGMTWPPFTAVLGFILDPQKGEMLARAALSTTAMVAIGYLGGTLAGAGVAVLAHFLASLRPGMDRLASLMHSIPMIALAPIFIVLMSRDYTGTAIAGMNVFFIAYVAMTSGLASGSKAGLDLFQVLGASPITRFLHHDMPIALPAFFGGLSYAVPVAFIGVILGEWFGASRGVGLLMVTAMQNFQIPLLWSAVLVTSVISLVAYATMTRVERYVQGLYR